MPKASHSGWKHGPGIGAYLAEPICAKGLNVARQKKQAETPTNNTIPFIGSFPTKRLIATTDFALSVKRRRGYGRSDGA
jgi:hypothetical protein